MSWAYVGRQSHVLTWPRRRSLQVVVKKLLSGVKLRRTPGHNVWDHGFFVLIMQAWSFFFCSRETNGFAAFTSTNRSQGLQQLPNAFLQRNLSAFSALYTPWPAALPGEPWSPPHPCGQEVRDDSKGYRANHAPTSSFTRRIDPASFVEESWTTLFAYLNYYESILIKLNFSLQQ